MASPFSNYLESIAGELRLTTAGKVRLCAFPDRALEHVLDCYRKKKKTLEGDYGRWLWGCANEYCKQLSLTPNWHYSNQLAYQLDVDIDAQLTTQKLPALTKTPSFSAEPVPPRAASHKVWRKLEERTPEDPAILQEKIAQKLADPNLPPFQRMLLEKLVPPKTHIKNGSHQNKKV